MLMLTNTSNKAVINIQKIPIWSAMGMRSINKQEANVPTTI